MAGLVSAQNLFDTQGKAFTKAKQKYREPKIIIDTVRMDNGFGYLTLNKAFSQGTRAVEASSTNDIHTQITGILTDSTATVRNFNVLYKTVDTVLIISSDSNDSGLVEALTIIR